MPARVALTLRLLGGLTTVEIARAYLVPETTVAQRIVRAKKALARAEVPFEVPGADERPARLASVLEVIYLIFNEGYSATAGEDWMRPALCADAVRLGRILAQIAPDEPEVHGLVALMEIQSSRLAARTDAEGNPVLLLDQDRLRWDRLLISRGMAALGRAEALGGAHRALCPAGRHRRLPRPRLPGRRTPTGPGSPPSTGCWPGSGPPRSSSSTGPSPSRWPTAPRPASISWRRWPIVPSLRSYHLLPSVRGDLLVKLGRLDEARIEYERAAEMTDNARERALSLARAEAVAVPQADSRSPTVAPRAT